MIKYKFVFSLGYRCSSAGILKTLGLKQESYPFDWMVSRLPIVKHCIETDFAEFLDRTNYAKKHSATYNYPTPDPISRQWICDESIRVNYFYESASPSIYNSNLELYLVPYLNSDHDAYSHKLMMNHHDITEDKDHAYYERCVNRWNQMCKSTNNKLSLYIHPAIFKSEYDKSKLDIQEDLRRFHRSIGLVNHDGIYIIPVKTPYDIPTNHCAKYVLEEMADDDLTPNCRICILWTNSEFIDAGEIFMGKCYVETYVVKEYVQKTAANGLL